MAGDDDRVSVEAIVYMALLALQFGCQPLLNKSFLSRDIIRTTPVIIGELFKFIVGGFMLFIVEGKSRVALRNWSLKDSLSKAGLPAFIYAFQNLLIMQGFLHLDGLTVNLINQTKTIFTAICVYLLLGRRQSGLQCVALAMLFGASVLLALDKTPESKANAHLDVDYNTWFFGGVLPVFAASMLSGIASALSQRSLQGQERNSFLFSMELSVYSAITLVIRTYFAAQSSSGDEASDGDKIMSLGFFHAWHLSTILPILSNSVGGILVGLVMKHAGGVRKGFSILAGILLTGYLDVMVAGNPLTLRKMVALPIVLFASYLHIVSPYAKQSQGDKQKKEK